MGPLISAYHRRDSDQDEIRAVQVLGIDVILDRSFTPSLLEMNNGPSLRVSDPETLRDDDLSLFPRTTVSIDNAGTKSVNSSYTEGCLRCSHSAFLLLQRSTAWPALRGGRRQLPSGLVHH